jgi:hypothetical protein
MVVIVSACLCCVKEDMPLDVAGAALFWFFGGRLIAGLILGVASVLTELLLLFVVIPHFSSSGHYAYIGGEARGPQNLAQVASGFVEHLFSWRGIFFLILIALTCGLGLRSRLVLVLVPTVLFRYFASDSIYLGFRYHYGVLITAICFIALLEIWSKWNQPDSPHPGDKLWARLGAKLPKLGRFEPSKLEWRKVVTGAQVLLLAGLVAWGMPESSAPSRVRDLFDPPAKIAGAAEVMAQIPDGAKVVSDIFLVPLIVDRTQVTDARPDWTDETGIPLSGDYVLLDTATIAHENEETAWVIDRIATLEESGEYTQIAQENTFVLLRKE